MLVVDDAEPTRLLVARALAAEGFIVDRAADAREARSYLTNTPPDVVVLDVELPDASGFDLLREITQSSGIPVVLLTGRGREADRVHGLEQGAEDYVVKPFFPRELAARVRRAAGRPRTATHDHVPGPTRLVFDSLSIDIVTREVAIDARLVDFTSREFDLLAHLAGTPRKVFSRDELLASVWHSSPEWQSPKTVTEHVRRIRQKIEADPRRPRWIRTVSGAGYRFEP